VSCSTTSVGGLRVVAIVEAPPFCYPSPSSISSGRL
jgi:hypothetical protein